jgi:hypothetical protein
MHSPFALSDAEALRGLVTAAGFQNVHVRIEMTVIRQRALDAFVAGYLAATPAASAIAALDETVRTAILGDVKTALRAYLDDDGLAAPLTFHVVTARKPASGAAREA